MIKIQKSATADSRTSDYKNVTIEQLRESNIQHIRDVRAGLEFFGDKLEHAGLIHDSDKFTRLARFHSNFIAGFTKRNRDWLDSHYIISRHHLHEETGIPVDVNLLDVLEMITDWTMAGLGRSGKLRPLHFTEDFMELAVQNTIKLLANNVEIEG